MGKKPKEPDSSNGNGAKSRGDPSSSSSSVFKTLFGDVAEHHASASIFSDDNPFRRKPSDRCQTSHQQGGLGLGSGSAEGGGNTTHADNESADLFEAKKRKRAIEKKASPDSDSVDETSETPLQRKKKSKKDERKSSNSGAESGEKDAAKNGDIGLDSKESKKEGKGRKRNLGTGLIEASKIGKVEYPNLDVEAAKDRDVGMEQAKGVEMKKKKRKRDELEAAYEATHYGVAVTNEEGGEGGMGGKTVGKKRKKVDDQVDMVVPKEGFDDEAKLLRTVFVGNIPLKVKKKSLFKEFSQYGEVESVRVRSVPILDTKKPRKCAIIQKKINDAVDSVHAYIVFKTEDAAQASLGHNMAVVGGNHIRVDRACPPRKKLKGESIPLYDNKRTIFVGNLPFDVKDEEIYQLFSGIKDLESNIEAIRVIRDPGTSLGKGIAYILFKTRGAANLVAKKHSLKLRDRELRFCHARSTRTPPSKRQNVSSKDGNDLPTKKLAVDSRTPDSSNSKVKTRAANSYQGLRASKSSVQKKVHPKTFEPAKLKPRTQNGEKTKERKHKRPAVAARKANALKGRGASKQAGKKRKLESRTPENAPRPKKKTRKHR